MRLATFGTAGQEQPAVVLDDMLLPLADRLRTHGLCPRADSVLTALPLVERIVAAGRYENELVPVSHVRLGPPIPHPSKIIEVGFNTWSLLRASNTARFAEPALYAKAPNAVIGSNDAIVRPVGTRKLDYEVELAVVIGRRCRAVAEREATEFIAGYTIANDVTARDMQYGEAEGGRYHRQNYHSKSFDTFCPLGPVLVTADEVSAPESLALRTYVNGELRQKGGPSDLVCSIPALIEFISAGMTLEVGDVILTGSPSGTGYLMDPQVFLEDGDVVTGVIDGIGRIENVVRDGRALIGS